MRTRSTPPGTTPADAIQEAGQGADTGRHAFAETFPTGRDIRAARAGLTAAADRLAAVGPAAQGRQRGAGG